MKKLNLFILTFTFCILHFAFFSHAQSPQSFNYQLIARDNAGLVLSNQSIGIQISILQDATGGPVVYSERHTATTNNYGLANLTIGTGSIISGSFGAIDWAHHTHFLKLEIDPSGGTNYFTMGTTQLVSVPYSIYAENAGTLTDTTLISKWTQTGENIYNNNSGNVGIGTNAPTGKLIVKGDSLALASEPLFEVKNKDGDPVFIVYPDSVRIIISESVSKASAQGGFAVSGRSSSKGATGDYFIITPDSARIYLEDASGKATALGGFAVSGRSSSKGTPPDYLRVTPDSTRIYTGDTIKGFGVQNIGASTLSSYLQLTPNNYFIGHKAGNAIASGKYNSFIGYQAGFSDTSGSKNYFIGYRAGYTTSSGWSNIFVGDSTGFSNTSGTYNIFIGNKSGYSNDIGTGNMFFGYQSGYQTTIGNHNIAIGFMSLYSNITGSLNTSYGYQSLRYNQASYNTAVGHSSLNQNILGNFNTAVGMNSLYFNTNGVRNNAYGHGALFNNTIGGHNVALGYSALNYNTSGSYNTALGNYAFYTGDNYSNSTALGYSAEITASNQVRIGDMNVTSIGGYADWSTVSDEQFKKNVTENVPGLVFINKLKPVTYFLDMNKIAEFLKTPDSLRLSEAEKIKGSILQTGFLAQEVEKAAREIGFDFSGVDKPKNENDFYGLRYAEFTVPLVKAVQELNAQNEDLKLKIAQLQTENIVLKSKSQEIDSLKAEMEKIKILLGASAKK